MQEGRKKYRAEVNELEKRKTIKINKTKKCGLFFFLRQKGNTIKLMDSGQTDQEKNRHK